jgi:hypothetical protein
MYDSHMIVSHKIYVLLYVTYTVLNGACWICVRRKVNIIAVVCIFVGCEFCIPLT